MQRVVFTAVFALIFLFRCFSQQGVSGIPDSLANKNYQFYIERLNADERDTAQTQIYCRAYLAKARYEKNWKEAMYAYKGLLYASPQRERHAFADSMLVMARKTADPSLLGSAYLTKGVVYYNEKKYADALDNYLEANRCIPAKGDGYLVFKVRFNIAQIKYYLGFYNEAIQLLRDCVAFYRQDGGKPYLSSLHSLGLCYNRIGRYSLSSELNRLGLIEAVRIGDESTLPYFTQSEGINQYFLKNYKEAGQLLGQALPDLEKTEDRANVTVTWFYIGKSLLHQHKGSSAWPCIKKVEQAFTRHGYIRPDLREAFELLIRHARQTGDLRARLYYIDKLLLADKVLLANYKYLSGKIYKEYDTRELVAEKRAIEGELEDREGRDRLLVGAIAILLVAVVIFWYRYRAARRRYKKNFEAMMENRGKVPASEPRNPVAEGEMSGLNPAIIEYISGQLVRFENSKGFLRKEMSLTAMAKLFDSNNTYVSKVIAYKKGKGVVEYINDLRIDHVIELLGSEDRYRQYSVSGLARHAGFKSRQSFAKAFLKRVGMPPAFYIKELERKRE